MRVEQNERVGKLALNTDRYLEYYMAVSWESADCTNDFDEARCFICELVLSL